MSLMTTGYCFVMLYELRIIVVMADALEQRNCITVYDPFTSYL